MKGWRGWQEICVELNRLRVVKTAGLGGGELVGLLGCFRDQWAKYVGVGAGGQQVVG